METDVLALDFTYKGYLIMFGVLCFAGLYGAALAHRQGRNKFFWFAVCACVPMCLFFLAGIHSRNESRKDKAEKEALEAKQNAKSTADTEQSKLVANSSENPTH